MIDRRTYSNGWRQQSCAPHARQSDTSFAQFPHGSTRSAPSHRQIGSQATTATAYSYRACQPPYSHQYVSNLQRRLRTAEKEVYLKTLEVQRLTRQRDSVTAQLQRTQKHDTSLNIIVFPTRQFQQDFQGLTEQAYAELLQLRSAKDVRILESEPRYCILRCATFRVKAAILANHVKQQAYDVHNLVVQEDLLPHERDDRYYMTPVMELLRAQGLRPRWDRAAVRWFTPDGHKLRLTARQDIAPSTNPAEVMAQVHRLQSVAARKVEEDRADADMHAQPVQTPSAPHHSSQPPQPHKRLDESVRSTRHNVTKEAHGQRAAPRPSTPRQSVRAGTQATSTTTNWKPQQRQQQPHPQASNRQQPQPQVSNRQQAQRCDTPQTANAVQFMETATKKLSGMYNTLWTRAPNILQPASDAVTSAQLRMTRLFQPAG